MANEFASRGFEVDMVLMAAFGELAPLLDSRIRVVDLGVKRLRSVLMPLIRYLRGERPSSLLACMWPLTVIAAAATAFSRAKTRVVVAEHTTWSASRERGGWLRQRVMSATMCLGYRATDGVVAVSNGAADDLARIAGFPRKRISMIHNPIVGAISSGNPEIVSDVREWSEGGHRKLIAVGSFKKVKDYPTLLMAFAVLVGDVDARLLILGEGEEREAIERLVEDLGIAGKVFLPGFVTDTAAYYRLADLHVLSSTAEGFGNVIVEALEHGVPVVSTDCPSGPREILCHGRIGTLVPVGDHVALASAMLDSLRSAHDGAALRERSGDFSVAKAADSYLDLLVPRWREAGAIHGDQA